MKEVTAMKLHYKITAPFLLVCILFIAAPAAALNEAEISEAQASAIAAGVSDDALNRILAQGYKYDLSPKHVHGYLNILAEAARQGLPVEPLASKIEEGTAKRVPPMRITPVVKQMLERYRSTRDAVAQVVPQAEISADTLVRLADSLTVGITPDEMDRYLSMAPATSLDQVTSGLEFLAALKQLGIDPLSAEQVVTAGLNSEYFEDTDWGLAHTLAAAKRNGTPAATLASAALKGVNKEQSTVEVCENLGLDPEDLGVTKPQRSFAGFGHGSGAGGATGGSGPGGSGDSTGGNGGSASAGD